MTRVEWGGGAEIAETDFGGVERVESGEGLDDGEPAVLRWDERERKKVRGERAPRLTPKLNRKLDPPSSSFLLGFDLGHPHIGKDASFQVLHHIKGCSQYGSIQAESVDFGDGDRTLVAEGFDDAVLAFDGMGGLGYELAWRFLAEDVLRSFGRGEEVSRVAVGRCGGAGAGEKASGLAGARDGIRLASRTTGRRRIGEPKRDGKRGCVGRGSVRRLVGPRGCCCRVVEAVLVDGEL